MASNLTRSTAVARKLLIVFVIFAVISFLFQWITISTTKKPITTPGVNYDNTAYVLPNNKFGNIPIPQIKSLTLAENTSSAFAITGNKKFSEFPVVVNVYKLEAFRDRLGNADKARKIANTLGFPSLETQLSDNTMTWNNNALTRTLSYNKVLQSWLMEANITKDPFAIKPKALDPTIDYSQIGKNIHNTLNLNSEYLASANARVDYVILNSTGKFQSMPDLTLAKYVRIAQYRRVEASTLKTTGVSTQATGPKTTFFSDVRKNDYLSAPSEIILSGKGDKISEDLIYFKYKDYTYSDIGVYPLKKVEYAWEDVQNNKGYLYWLKAQNEDSFSAYIPLNVREFRVDVEKTQLIYIEPEERLSDQEWTQYLQPFYYFAGTAIINDGRKAEFAFLANALETANYKQ